MNWYNLFYWITRADSIKNFFDVASNIFTTLAVVSFIGMVVTSIGSGSAISENRSVNEEKDKTDPDIRSWNKIRRYISYLFYPLLILSILTWVGYVFTPTKKDALLIVAGGGAMQFLTTDSSAKKLPSEAMNYVVTELKSMAAEAKVDLGVTNQKEKIIDEAKNLTADELMNRMKLDSNFAKIILGK